MTGSQTPGGGGTPLSEPDRKRLRQRAVWTLVAGVALGTTGHIAAVTVAPIAMDEMAGTSAWSGAPGAAVVLGAAIGASALSALMARRGRRPGVVAGYAVGIVGAVIAIAGIVGGSVAPLLIGTFLVGFGNTSTQLSRYVAADMFADDRRASAIGTVVWAATVGAVVGPNLIGPAGVVAQWFGLPRPRRRLSHPDRVRRAGSRPVVRLPPPGSVPAWRGAAAWNAAGGRRPREAPCATSSADLAWRRRSSPWSPARRSWS